MRPPIGRDLQPILVSGCPMIIQFATLVGSNFDGGYFTWHARRIATSPVMSHGRRHIYWTSDVLVMLGVLIPRGARRNGSSAALRGIDTLVRAKCER